MYALLQRRDTALAVLGSIAITALSVIQFVDPTPNWYCLFFCVVLACWLTWVPSVHPARLVGAGLLIGVLTLFRQLSGVWVAMAVLVLVLLERSDDRRERGGWLARALLLVMFTALIGYLVLSLETEPGGVLLIAAWPLAILAWAFVAVRTTNDSIGAAVGQLAIGVVISAWPLAVYHLAHASWGGWVNDTVVAAFGETQMPFFAHGWYGVLPLAGLYQAISSMDGTKIANGLYWAVLSFVSPANGVVILARLRRNRRPDGLALPLLASFYALVSLYLVGPLYLYYTVGLSLVALLWLSATGSRLRRMTLAATAASISLVAVIFHAGQSRLRTPVQILQGDRVTRTWTTGGEGLARCRLKLDQADRDVYGRLVTLIQAETAANESIFALPNDAELYFLANRRNAFRFYNAALGIRTADELSHVIRELNTRPPRLVTFRPDDKYNTDASRQIMDLVRAKYAPIKTMDGFEIYVVH